mmetsp:Transcript_7775/g.14120  ORF Transcript_7775/g.14120 Transcript_7775/m.14120 type:complete len:256 (+) Transcript_7775:69-836(+)
MVYGGSIYFHVPNVIGYFRILIGALAFAYSNNVARFSILYAISFVLDAADGYAARILSQSSEFGALLDMITDRVGTFSLLVMILQLFISQHSTLSSLISSSAATINAIPRWREPIVKLSDSFPLSLTFIFLIISLIVLDGISHWMQMLAGVALRSDSHKKATESMLVRWYYWRPVLTIVCILNELFLLMIYVLLLQAVGDVIPLEDSALPWWAKWNYPPAFIWLCIIISGPVCFLKQIISVKQIFSAHGIIRKVV